MRLLYSGGIGEEQVEALNMGFDFWAGLYPTPTHINLFPTVMGGFRLCRLRRGAHTEIYWYEPSYPNQWAKCFVGYRMAGRWA